MKVEDLIWKRQDGTEMKIVDMSAIHLKNAYEMCVRNCNIWQDVLQLELQRRSVVALLLTKYAAVKNMQDIIGADLTESPFGEDNQ